MLETHEWSTELEARCERAARHRTGDGIPNQWELACEIDIREAVRDEVLAFIETEI